MVCEISGWVANFVRQKCTWFVPCLRIALFLLYLALLMMIELLMLIYVVMGWIQRSCRERVDEKEQRNVCGQAGWEPAKNLKAGMVTRGLIGNVDAAIHAVRRFRPAGKTRSGLC